MDLGSCAEEVIAELADEVATQALGRLRRKCFVIMPFSELLMPVYDCAIRPAIEASGMLAVRADQLNLVGNAVSVLREAIRVCDSAIAVITGSNPNVIYELGFAHAEDKPVLILARYRAQDDKTLDLPFDLRTEYVVGYGEDHGALSCTIESMLQCLDRGRDAKRKF